MKYTEYTKELDALDLLFVFQLDLLLFLKERLLSKSTIEWKVKRQAHLSLASLGGSQTEKKSVLSKRKHDQ